jgi:hypothetical protein
MILAKIGVNIIASILIMIGGLIGILSVFTAWFTLDLWLTSVSWSGWEIFRDSTGDLADGYSQWMPLVVLIFSVIAALIGLFSLFKPSKTIGGGAIVCGILVLVGAILFATYTETAGPLSMKYMDFIDTGVYLAIVAGIVIIVFGAVRMISKEK